MKNTEQFDTFVSLFNSHTSLLGNVTTSYNPEVPWDYTEFGMIPCTFDMTIENIVDITRLCFTDFNSNVYKWNAIDIIFSDRKLSDTVSVMTIFYK